MEFKFKKIFSSSINPKNKQISFHLRRKELHRLGLTPEQLNEMLLLKPKIKFKKNVK
jgi:multidrug efflux pump subunit AcrB